MCSGLHDLSFPYIPQHLSLPQKKPPSDKYKLT
jgi:hypothetical protein